MTAHWKRLGTVRTRLTVGNVLLLVLHVLVLSVLLRYAVVTGFQQQMDQDMVATLHPLTSRFSLAVLSHLREEHRQGLGLRIDPTSALGLSRAEGWLPLRAMDTDRHRLLSGEPVVPYSEAGFERAVQGQQNHLTVTVAGKKARVLSVPLRSDLQVVGVLQVARSYESLQHQIDRVTKVLILFVPFAVLTAGGIGWLVTARVLKPVRTVTQAAARIEASDLAQRLPAEGTDEFAELASTFNGMLERLERAFAQQRQFTADASHELRTPLAVITGEVTLALTTERSATEYQRTLEGVAMSANRMYRIVQDLLVLARAEEGKSITHLELLVLSPVLLQAVEQVRKLNAVAPSLVLRLPNDSEAEIVGDPHYLERLFVNLIENAVQYTPADGTVEISLSGLSGSVVVSVRDTGEGIASEHLPHIFDSFYRVDSSRARHRGGAGLGLAICRRIVEAHHGEITVESQVGQGTTVTVTFPQVRLSQST